MNLRLEVLQILEEKKSKNLVVSIEKCKGTAFISNFISTETHNSISHRLANTLTHDLLRFDVNFNTKSNVNRYRN